MEDPSFTRRTRRVLELAQSDAKQRHHETVTPEHITLGLVLEGEGVAIAVLRNLGVSPRSLWTSIEAVLPPGIAERVQPLHLPLSPITERILAHARADARSRGHTYIGTEHLLMGIVLERDTQVARLLAENGVHVENAAAATDRLLGSDLRLDRS